MHSGPETPKNSTNHEKYAILKFSSRIDLLAFLEELLLFKMLLLNVLFLNIER